MNAGSAEPEANTHIGSHLQLSRSHIFGIDSWPPQPSVRAHLDALAHRIQDQISGSTFLDVGCGDGSLSRILAETCRNVDFVGVDVAPHPLWGSRLPPNLQFVVGSATRPPFPETSFDHILIKDVLHHMAEPKSTLSTIRRLARRTTLVVEANRYNPISYVWMVRIHKHEHFSRRALRRVIGIPVSLDSFETHVWPPRMRPLGNAFERIMNSGIVSWLANYNLAVIEEDQSTKSELSY